MSDADFNIHIIHNTCSYVSLYIKQRYRKTAVCVKNVVRL